MSEDIMKELVSLCKRRGFIFQGSEIYGGLSGIWDYGPLGVELKNNIKQAWWKTNVWQRQDMVGLDAAIIMHPKTWQASGHVKSFADLMVDCKNCRKRFRTDTVGDKCPECGGEFTDKRSFNLMLKTFVGPVEDKSSLTYLRPETAQGIFINFANILDSARKKLPFGIAQIGKAFRNEVTPGNFIFRTREFEQMELEYFVSPAKAQKEYDNWVRERFNWYISLGINKKNLRTRVHAKEELAHYAAACTDIEYNFPFGWSELEGIANRQDYDLRQHSSSSGQELVYFDAQAKEHFYPYIIEPSGGVDRAALAFLVDAYRKEKVKGETRVVLGFSKELAPVKVAVLALLRNRPELVNMAQKIASELRRFFHTVYDDTASIGKLYRRQDETGTLYCVTVDVQSLEDKKVTVRDRDTMKQERIEVDRLKEYISGKLND